MSIDFNSQYTLNTNIGKCAVLLFHYLGDMSTDGTILDSSKVQYKGSFISDTDIEYEASVVSAGTYSDGKTPSLGRVDILHSDGTPYTNAYINSSGDGNYDTAIIHLIGVNTNGAYMNPASNELIDAHIICCVIDDNDNALFTVTFFRTKTETASFYPNTSTSFGFINGKPYPYPPTLTKADGTLITNFSTSAYADILSLWISGDDPYEQGGSSGTGGGTGTFSGTGDAISIPSLPTLSAVDAGFITLFNPSITQLNNLASYMWSDLFDIDGWRKIFADPMNAILGLSIVPVNVPSGNVKTVKVGNISTGVSMTVAASQYVEVDCGTLNVQEFWGAYLDYDPYTKAEIYLPYIGTHALAVDDIMNKSVHVVYHVDVLSGACCAYVQCGGTVLYTFIGQCSSSIPITGDNWTNVINGAISIAGSIGSMVATGGVSAPMEIGNIASTAVNTMKPSVEKSGAMGGTGGMMGVQTPYLILTRPRQALPARQNTFTGYPSFITEQLSTLSGYTEVFKIHLENVPATEQELSEIETLLKTGVIF